MIQILSQQGAIPLDPSKIIFIFELKKSFFDEFITSVISFDSYAMQYDVYFYKVRSHQENKSQISRLYFTVIDKFVVSFFPVYPFYKFIIKL